MTLLSTVPAAGGEAYDELGPAELARLERLATRWVLELEERERPLARPLSGAEKSALAGHFTSELLDRARLREVAGIANPGFYEEFFASRGMALPIDFRQASGLALVDTVLIVAHRVARPLAWRKSIGNAMPREAKNSS